jgi:hypothetical protein
VPSRSPAPLVIAVALALPASAGASPLSDALARHGDAEISALRAQRGDLAARCTLGAVYARRNDLPRAALYLTDCDHAALPDDIAAELRSIMREVKRRLDASHLAALDVMSHPEGLTAEIDAMPGESFTTPTMIWVEPGAHQVRASLAERAWTQRVTAEPHKNSVILIETGLGATPPPPRTTTIDFAKDDPGGTLGEQHTGPPPDIKHPPLIKDKYRGIPDPASGDPIDDPLAVRGAPARERTLWLGARLGLGLFDEASAAARAGIALALTGRYRLTGALFLAARADWSRRGGEVMTGTIDVLGASAGLGVTVIGRSSALASPPASSLGAGPAAIPGSSSPASSPAPHGRTGLALALTGQLRADLRLAEMRDAMPVRRAGLSVAAGAELALPKAPFTVGLRLEQGVTELVPGARDRAVLAEVGIDLR